MSGFASNSFEVFGADETKRENAPCFGTLWMEASTTHSDATPKIPTLIDWLVKLTLQQSSSGVAQTLRRWGISPPREREPGRFDQFVCLMWLVQDGA
ncbi:hypothetical protein ColTof3_04621 [Colletotrichum tofieldiae]|nr:hypothetical protein ColTof3_04621 [Colletotrichum tofieldiae]